MSDEDLKTLTTHLDIIGDASESVGKIISAAKLVFGGLATCLVLCVTSILWVNAKANAITVLETNFAKMELSREASSREQANWRIEVEKIMATTVANQKRVIEIQNQQADLIARHLDKS